MEQLEILQSAVDGNLSTLSQKIVEVDGSLREEFFHKVIITPDCARFVLKNRARKNRLLKIGAINRIISDIRQDNWLPGQPFFFVQNEGKITELIDGYHRLTAISRADKAVPAYVGFNFPEKLSGLLDQGTSRTFSQVLSMKEYKYTKILDGVVSSLLANRVAGIPYHIFHYTANSNLPFSISDKLNYFYCHKEQIVESVNWTSHLFAKGPLATRDKFYSLLHYHGTYILKRPKATAQFMTLLATGVGLTESNPVLAVREFILEHKKTSNYIKVGLLRSLPLVLGFNLFVTGDITGKIFRKEWKKYSVSKFKRLVLSHVNSGGKDIDIFS